jgi:hypothetical protein
VTRFEPGMELMALVPKNFKDFIGVLNLDTNHVLPWTLLPRGSLFFGVVLKGRLAVSSMGAEESFEEHSCLHVPGGIPFEFRNANFPFHLSILFLSETVDR